MADVKGRRTELIVFASLAAVLIVGVIVLIARPGRKTPQTAPSASASASSSAPKAAAMPTWTPPNFEDPDAALPPAPGDDQPVVIASSQPVVMASGSVPTLDKGQQTDDVFPLEAKTIQDTTNKYSPRLKTQCSAEKPQKVVLLVKIKPDGWVDTTTVQETDGAQTVADCVAKQVQRWHFKSSTWGGTASIPITVGK